MSTPETVVTGELPSSGAPPAETPQAEATPPVAAVVPSEAEAKEKSGISKRIDELTRLRRDAERERDRWYEIAMAKQKEVQPPPQPPAQPEGLKTLADFGWDEKRYAEHLLKQAIPKPELIRQTWQELQEQEASQRRIESFREREAAFAKEHEDYEEVAYYAPISDQIAQVIQEADEGPELAYYLGKNPDIAKKLSKLSMGAAAVELGKLSAKLALEKAKASEPSVSKTPPPTPKVEGLSEIPNIKSASDPESDKLSAEEWRKLREKEIRRKKS